MPSAFSCCLETIEAARMGWCTSFCDAHLFYSLFTFFFFFFSAIHQEAEQGWKCNVFIRHPDHQCGLKLRRPIRLFLFYFLPFSSVQTKTDLFQREISSCFLFFFLSLLRLFLSPSVLACQGPADIHLEISWGKGTLDKVSKRGRKGGKPSCSLLEPTVVFYCLQPHGNTMSRTIFQSLKGSTLPETTSPKSSTSSSKSRPQKSSSKHYPRSASSSSSPSNRKKRRAKPSHTPLQKLGKRDPCRRNFDYNLLRVRSHYHGCRCCCKKPHGVYGVGHLPLENVDESNLRKRIPLDHVKKTLDVGSSSIICSPIPSPTFLTISFFFL